MAIDADRFFSGNSVEAIGSRTASNSAPSQRGRKTFGNPPMSSGIQIKGKQAEQNKGDKGKSKEAQIIDIVSDRDEDEVGDDIQDPDGDESWAKAGPSNASSSKKFAKIMESSNGQDPQVISSVGGRGNQEYSSPAQAHTDGSEDDMNIPSNRNVKRYAPPLVSKMSSRSKATSPSTIALAPANSKHGKTHAPNKLLDLPVRLAVLGSKNFVKTTTELVFPNKITEKSPIILQNLGASGEIIRFSLNLLSKASLSDHSGKPSSFVILHIDDTTPPGKKLIESASKGMSSVAFC